MNSAGGEGTCRRLSVGLGVIFSSVEAQRSESRGDENKQSAYCTCFFRLNVSVPEGCVPIGEA